MAWIDMRAEMGILMHGGYGSVGQAYWGVIRIFRLNQKSPYWVEGTNEAINGPEYYYDDHIVKIISYPASRFSLTDRIQGGLDSVAVDFNDAKDTFIFAIEYNTDFARVPTEKDLIYHIDKYESVNPPAPPLTVTDRFKIIHAFLEYGDNGRAEMFYCIGVRTHGES